MEDIAADQVKIVGFAVISADGFIAQKREQVTSSWASAEDWQYLQARLLEPGVRVMGRISHLMYPNKSGAPRAVFSRNPGFQPNDSLARLILPDRFATTADLARELTAIFKVATLQVLGGASVYTYFLGQYDEFHLSVEQQVRFSRGIALFEGDSLAPSDPYQRLLASGMQIVERKTLNNRGCEVVVYRKKLC